MLIYLTMKKRKYIQEYEMLLLLPFGPDKVSIQFFIYFLIFFNHPHAIEFTVDSNYYFKI